MSTAISSKSCLLLQAWMKWCWNTHCTNLLPETFEENEFSDSTTHNHIPGDPRSLYGSSSKSWWYQGISGHLVLTSLDLTPRYQSSCVYFSKKNRHAHNCLLWMKCWTYRTCGHFTRWLSWDLKADFDLGWDAFVFPVLYCCREVPPLKINMYPDKGTNLKGNFIFQPSILGWYVFRGVLLIWTSWEEKIHLAKCVPLSTSVKIKKQFIFRLSSSSNSPCQWSKFRSLNTAMFARPLDWMLILGGKGFNHLGVVRKYTSKSAKKKMTRICSSPIFWGEVKTQFENFTQKKKEGARPGRPWPSGKMSAKYTKHLATCLRFKALRFFWCWKINLGVDGMVTRMDVEL